MCACVCVDPEGLQGEDQAKPDTSIALIYLSMGRSLDRSSYLCGSPLFLFPPSPASPPPPQCNLLCLFFGKNKTEKKRKNENAITINYNKTF